MNYCIVEECDKQPTAARGWCWKHYKRWYTTGDPTRTLRLSYDGVSCAVEECDRQAAARNWCDMHYTRWRTRGTTDRWAVQQPESDQLFTCRDCLRTLDVDQAIKQPPNHRIFLCRECNKRKALTWGHEQQDQTTEPTVTEKWCPACDQTLPADHFYRATKNLSGLQTYCAECQKLQQEDGFSVKDIRTSLGKPYKRTRPTQTYRISEA